MVENVNYSWKNKTRFCVSSFQTPITSSVVRHQLSWFSQHKLGVQQLNSTLNLSEISTDPAINGSVPEDCFYQTPVSNMLTPFLSDLGANFGVPTIPSSSLKIFETDSELGKSFHLGLQFIIKDTTQEETKCKRYRPGTGEGAQSFRALSIYHTPRISMCLPIPIIQSFL